MASKVTMDEIARRLGVSKTTVSLALANKPGVSDEVRKPIIDMAGRLGYSPHSSRVAPLLKRRAVLVVFQRNPVQTEISGLALRYLDGIQTVADDSKLRVLITTIGPQELVPEHSIEIFRSEPVGILGALLMGLKSPTDPVISQLRGLGIPIAAVNRHWPHSDHSFVSVDNASAEADLVRYLCRLGHRKIAFACFKRDEGYSWLEQRQNGYLTALGEQGPTGRQCCVCAADRAQAVDAILHQCPDVTAICAANDSIALALISELRSRSILVPQDISVVGFDDDVSVPASDPPLTTIGFDATEMGYLAARTVLEQATRTEVIRTQITLRAHLVERESSGAPKAEPAASSLEPAVAGHPV
jgi:LacI family transcriptional regulator